MAKLKPNRSYKNHKAMIFSSELQEVVTVPVLDVIDGNNIETEEGVLPLDDAKRFFDANTGAVTYVFDLELPARVEASKLVQLRRSVAVKNMFNYDKDKAFDIFKFLPYVIAIIALLAS
jgi:hypothetical protein